MTSKNRLPSITVQSPASTIREESHQTRAGHNQQLLIQLHPQPRRKGRKNKLTQDTINSTTSTEIFKLCDKVNANKQEQTTINIALENKVNNSQIKQRKIDSVQKTDIAWLM